METSNSLATKIIGHQLAAKLFQKSFRPFLLLIIAAITVTVVSAFVPKTSSVTDGTNSTGESVDTLIPYGFVLVPIQVQNEQALDGLIGAFGLVDLFTPSTEPGRGGTRVAHNVKILRAPNNPSQFAVLVPEEMAPRIVRGESGYFVMVQNPKVKERVQLDNSKKTKRRLISVEG